MPDDNPHEANFPQGVYDAWACHEAFRRLGFSADDIYVIGSASVNNAGLPAIHSVLRTQGRELVVICGVYNTDAELEKVMEKYAIFLELYNAGFLDEDKMRARYERSMVGQDTLGFLTAIERKGIRIPRP